MNVYHTDSLPKGNSKFGRSCFTRLKESLTSVSMAIVPRHVRGLLESNRFPRWNGKAGGIGVRSDAGVCMIAQDPGPKQSSSM